MAVPKKGKVLFVINPVLGHVTAYLRGLIFKDILGANGWEVKYVNIAKVDFKNELDQLRKSKNEIIDLAKEYDIVYLLKVNSLKFIKELRKNTQAKIVFELTDALWKPAFRLRGWLHLEEILWRSSAIFSENEFVCEFGRKFNEHVYSLTACTQTEKFDQQQKTLVPRNDGKVVLGWIGSPDSITAIFSIVKPLERLFKKYSFLELRILGADAGKLKFPLRNIRYTTMASYNENDMIREALAIDIGLFPAPYDIEDYKIRGALKGMIYMTAGKPAVCLNAGDCSTIIKDGVNGMLISLEDEWETKIEKLILDPTLRKRMGELAYTTIKKEHSLAYAFHDLEKALLEVLLQDQEIRSGIPLFKRIYFKLLVVKSIIGMTPEVMRKLVNKIRTLAQSN